MSFLPPHRSWRFRWPAARRSAERVAWIALLAFIGYRIWPQIAAAAGIGTASDGATDTPAFEVVTLAGDTLAIERLRGQVVLVNFWATWCPPCRVEMPGFQSVYERRRRDGFVILGLSSDVASASVREFLDERGITYPVAMATRPVTRAFGDPRLLPTSFLIDRSGRIRHRVEGYFTSVALDQAVQRLLDEPAPPARGSGEPPRAD